MKPFRIVLLIVVVALLFIGLASQQVVPEVSAAAPLCLTSGGCLGFPDADDTSGRFINVTRGLSSLGDLGSTDNVFNVELRVENGGATASDFELAIFDGDLGKPWDVVPKKGLADPIIFQLYPDPTVSGNTSGTPLYEWPAKYMENDGWCVLDPAYPGDPSSDVCTGGARIPHDPAALAAGGENYFYHLVASWETIDNNNEQNNFKVVVEGEPFILPESTIGFMGYVPNDPLGGTSTYDGSWSFRFLVPEVSTEIQLWDGDTDRVDDTDDFNSPDLPVWTTYSSATLVQDARSGVPQDDISGPLGMPPNVYYEIKPPSDSGETWTVTNGAPGDLIDQPSGDKEWEKFEIGLDSGPAPDHGNPNTPDVTVPGLPKGLYQWNFLGLDGRNTMFIYSDYATFPGLAQLGNTVWYDADQDGVWAQTAAEPGIEGVLINLYLDEGIIGTFEPGIDTYLSSETTNNIGFYLFTGLDALDYQVQVDPSNFAPGGPLEGLLQTTTYGQGTVDDHHNRLSPWAASIPTNKYYTLADFGYFEGASCDLEVSKYCEIPLVLEEFVCKDAKPINELSMIWNGSENVRVKAWNGQDLVADIDNVQPGDTVQAAGFSDPPTDVIWEIFEAGTDTKIGESNFHLSCSDDDMNGPEDCGLPAGDGKDDSAGLINDWLFEGMVGNNGDALVCNPEPPDPTLSANCEAPLYPAPSCDTEGKPKALTFEFTGETCAASDNDQGDKFKCTDQGAIDPGLPVEIVYTGKDPNKITVSPTVVSVGEMVTLSATGRKELHAGSKLKIYQDGVLKQSMEIHASCSVPLEIGDIFASLKLLKINGKSEGVDVNYFYEVTNNGPALTNFTVTDIPLGPIAGPLTLAAGETQQFSTSANLTETTTNEGVFSGIAASGQSCEATAFATVTLTEPPVECEASGDSKLKFRRDYAEWKLTNNGSNNLVIEGITVTWPTGNGILDVVKLGRDTIHKGNFSPDTAVIDSGWEGTAKKRTIEDDKTETLKLKFKDGASKTGAYAIEVKFEQGCTVKIETGSGGDGTFTCEKPLDALTMTWDGSVPVTIKAWKDSPGETLLYESPGAIGVGDDVTVTGYAPKDGNDVIWEVFAASGGTKLGESVFHMSCSDDDMDGETDDAAYPNDCGKREGDGKGGSGLNDWLLAGMVDANGPLICAP